MCEWVAIQQLFSLGRTCLNYPNESEWLWLPRTVMGDREPFKAIHERLVEQGPSCVGICVCVCVCERERESSAECGCPVKLNGACRVPNEPVLAGGLTHSDLPLCTSLSHLGCQGIAVNPDVPWTLAFAKPIHIFNEGLAWRTLTFRYLDLPLFLPCLVKREFKSFCVCDQESLIVVMSHESKKMVPVFWYNAVDFFCFWHKVMEAALVLYINLCTNMS